MILDTKDFEEGMKEGEEIMRKHVLKLIREAPDKDYVGEFLKKELDKLEK